MIHNFSSLDSKIHRAQWVFRRQRLTLYVSASDISDQRLPLVETDPQKTFTDPAARLIQILQTGLDHTAANQAFQNFWANALEVQPEDRIALHRGLGLLRVLVDNIESGIRKIPDIRHEQYLKNLPLLRDLLSRTNLGESWTSEANVLRMIVNSLEFASERIQANDPEPVLLPSELDGIRKQADELLQLLEKSTTLPRELKLILFDLVKGILRSVDEYRFRGIRGVRRELFAVASVMQEHLPTFQKHKDAEEVRGFLKFLKRVDVVTSTALKVKELVGASAPFLNQLPALLENAMK